MDGYIYNKYTRTSFRIAAESPHVLQRAIQRFRAHARAACAHPHVGVFQAPARGQWKDSLSRLARASHAPCTLPHPVHARPDPPCSGPPRMTTAAHVSSSSTPQYVSRTPRIANSVTCHGSSDSDSSRFGWRAHR